MLFEISKNLGKSCVTHIQPAEEQTTKKIKIINVDKTEICEIKSTRNVKKNDSRK